jgi:hypothetical protein
MARDGLRIRQNVRPRSVMLPCLVSRVRRRHPAHAALSGAASSNHTADSASTVVVSYESRHSS